MKSFKNMDKKSFKKRDFLEIADGFKIPLMSLSGRDKYKKIDLGIEPPTKVRAFTKEEMQKYKEDNPNVNYQSIKAFRAIEMDLTDKDYQEKIKDADFDLPIIELCKHIDLLYIMDSGEELWKDLELKNSEDYLGLSKKLFSKEEDGGLDLGDTLIKKMQVKIRALEGEDIFRKISKLEEMYNNKDAFALNDDLNSLITLKEEVAILKVQNEKLLEKINELEVADDDGQGE